MFCTNCGANQPDGTKFCTVCGASMEASAPVEPIAPAYAPETEAPAETNKFDVDAVKDQLFDTLQPVTKKCKSVFSNKKARLGIIAGIVLLVVIGVVAAILFGGNGYVAVKQEVVLMAEDGTLNIAVNGKLIKDTIDLPVQKDRNGNPEKDEEGNKQYYSYGSTSSMDGKITAIWVRDYIMEYDENGWYKDSYYDGELYVLNGKKLQLIAEDVCGYDISVSGKGITYTTKNESKEDDKFTTYTLNLYNVGTKKSVTISDEATGLGELSPNGKSVAYFVGDYNKKTEETEYTLMLYSGKKSTEITDKDVTLIGLSNNGKYIYAVENEEKDGKSEQTMLCFNNKGKSTKLGECEDDYGYMNKDHTQVMFYNDGETYIATKNKSAERVSKKHLDMVTPKSAGSSNYTYPVSDLYGKTYEVETAEGRDVYLIKKGGKSNKLVDGGYYITMDESGQYIYYITEKNDLKCVQISMNQNAKSKAVEIAEDVDEYQVTSNRKYVYFITDDSELLCVNGKKGGKAKEVCGDDVRGIILTKGDVLFYIVGEVDDNELELFSTKNGKKGTSVLDDVTGVKGWTRDYVYLESDENVYVSSGKKMKKLELK